MKDFTFCLFCFLLGLALFAKPTGLFFFISGCVSQSLNPPSLGPRNVVIITLLIFMILVIIYGALIICPFPC